MKTFIDLFAGCGGLSLGFQKAGWQLKFAVESHADAFSTYRANLIDRPNSNADWPAWLPCESNEIVRFIDEYRGRLESIAGTIDLIVGGPPCQGFSMNGRRRPDDPRNAMVMSYLEMASILSPKMVLIENVRGITSLPRGEEETFSQFVLKELDRLGYDTWSQLITASEWGVPQRRPRFFLIAVRKGLLSSVNPFERLRTFRKSFLSSRGLPSDRAVTAKEALDDLRVQGSELIPDNEFGHLGFKRIRYTPKTNLSSFARWARKNVRKGPSDLRLPQHTKAVTRRFTRILKTCVRGRCISPTDRKRLGIKKRSTTPMSSEMPSPTVTTLPDDMIHYAEPRILTVREHARLQTFPDWFSFHGPYTSGGARRKHTCPRYTQVGNAVPPLLAEAIAEMLDGLLAPLSGEELANRPNVAEMNRQVLA